MIEPGKIFYWCTVDIEDGTCSIEEYHVRTVRGGFVHAIWKNSITWGKLSKKHGDYGWLKSIPEWCREKWRVAADPPAFLKTTKLAAIRHKIKTTKPGDFNDDDIYAKAVRALKSLETRNRKK